MTDRWPRPEGRDDDPIAALEKDHVDSVLERLREHRSTSSRHVEAGVLGQGGMGIVLEVRDADLRRPLALKRLHPKRRSHGDVELDRHFLARFLQEAQVTGQLAHPGIPPVHELSIDEQGPYFTMPVIRGQNLDEAFAKASAGLDGWSIPRALGVLLKVCEAMAFAHAKRVVHRDLKPENVRIGRFGEVYVMDWGLARVIGRDEIDLVRWSKSGALSSVHTDREDSDGDANAVLQTLDGDVLGTPYYMAPEQARGELERVGPRTDVYAVGGLLYMLLTGRAPYQPAEGRISPRTVLAAVLHGPPPTVASIAPQANADLVAVCEKAMAREPEARYAGMEELASDIEAWIERRPIQASAPSVRHALRLFAERHRAAVFTAAAGVLALLTTGTWFIFQLTEERDATESARADAQRRADSASASELQSRENGLWPAQPSLIHAMESWLGEATDITSRRSQYIEQQVRESQSSRTTFAWGELFARMDALELLQRSVGTRVNFAKGLEATTVTGAADAWREVETSLRSDERFRGLTLTPQLGLVPLWIEPKSGLWEFWHPASGARPTRGLVRADDGITMVLVPPADFSWHVPMRTGLYQRSTEVRAVRIAACFVSKFETTQAQFLRAMGWNPSLFQRSINVAIDHEEIRPVESISQLEATLFAARLGLELPDEILWEYCARAGTEADYIYGDEAECLIGFENIRDLSEREAAGQSRAPWSDGFRGTAPVGSLEGNPFGLQDMLGNVAEWTSTTLETEDDDPDLEPEQLPIRRKVYRGGSYYFGPAMSNPAVRQNDNERGLNQTRGVRLVRRPTASE